MTTTPPPTDPVRATITRRYTAGATIAHIADAVDLHPETVRAHLRRAGIPLRDDRTIRHARHHHGAPAPVPLHHNSALTHADLHAIIARYIAGETASQLANAFGIDPATVRRYLRAAGLTLRDDRSRRRIPVDTDDIAARHRAGESMTVIAEALGTTLDVVRHRLHERGIATDVTRTHRPDPRHLDLDIDDIVRRRRAGHTLQEIATALGCSTTAIEARLRPFGLHRSQRTPAPPVDTAAIAATYAAGRTISETAAHHDVTIDHVHAALREHHVPKRPPRRRAGRGSRAGAETADAAAVVDYYRAGHHIELTAARFGITHRAVRDILTAAGIEPRTRNPRVTPATRTAILIAATHGIPRQDIADQVGYSVKTVGKVLRAAATTRGKAR